MTTAALIVAAGRGTRFRSETGAPKQYVRLGDRAVLAHTVAAFLRHSEIDHVSVVIHREDAALYHEALGDMAQRCQPPATGGDTRQASVRLGLEALAADPPELVLIHDAARPFVSAEEISDTLRAARVHRAAMVATAVVDTLKRTDADGRIIETVSRDNMWRAQTPQAFAFDDILLIHREAHASGRAFTDDAALAEAAGRTVHVVPGRADNFKITTLDDLHMAERARASMIETRVGTGFDVHRLGDGDHVWLCGVPIAHSHTLVGHSDADVGLHALTDALLGAIGDGDIGAHFPPSDPKWKGAASDQLLADAARRARDRGGRIVNVDVTIMCEAPKVGPHRDAMRKRIAEILDIAVDRVGVKATTTERLGFTGRREGIAAQAVASVALPSPDDDDDDAGA